mmetsp:Transcript_4533/g.11264  ORF Transcript_4533/g.11264 Transcript_4533/m.11264 type:complete len:248 (-) Transcript_4533:265-1008(-)
MFPSHARAVLLLCALWTGDAHVIAPRQSLQRSVSSVSHMLSACQLKPVVSTYHASYNRLRGGAVAEGGLMAWIRWLRRLLFPGNPARARSSLPEPPSAGKKEPATSTGNPTGKTKGGRKGSTGRAGSVQEVHSKAEFEKMLKGVRSKQLVVVDFYATWCGPCKQIAPKFAAMAEALPHVKFVKVDVDQAKDVSQQYQVTAMPTFKMLRGGKEVGSMQGADDTALREKIEGLAGKPDRWASAGSGLKL